MNRARVALVTGGNKGIGLSIVKLLAQAEKSTHVILAARSEERGEAAVKSLALENVHFHQLDVTNKESINNLKNFLENKYGGLNVLVQNAGRAWKGDIFDEEVAKGTVDCNFWGVVNVWEALRDLVRVRKGRVVVVSSRAGNLGKIQKTSLRDQFVRDGVKAEDIKNLMSKFVDDVRKGTWKEEGWPRSTYGVSKIGVTAITKVWAAEEANHGVALYSCCPGWVATDVSCYFIFYYLC